MSFDNKAFSEWITKKYIEWRGDAIGREKTISDFAEWVGVSQQVMSSWMQPDGKIPRTMKSISGLAKRYGNEVYQVLAITPPVDIETENLQTLQQIAEILKDIPRDKHDGLVFAVRAWAANEGYIIVDTDKKE